MFALRLTFFLICLATAEAAAQNRIYFSTDEFEVTHFDLEMYLRDAPVAAGGGLGSRPRLLQALSDLYALEVLNSDADQEDRVFLNEEEAAWIADYHVKIEKVVRYTEWKMQLKMAATDWQRLSLETYLANQSDYMVPETVSVRNLLLRTDDRTIEEAVALAEELRASGNASEFAALAREFSEDEVGKVNGGLMENVQRGQTVEPFEQAAFALTEPGEISAPVSSRFGVHLIQLVDSTPARQQAYDEVSDSIIQNLKVKKRAQYISDIQNEAREREAAGFQRYVDNLDALIDESSTGALGSEVDLDAFDY